MPSAPPGRAAGRGGPAFNPEEWNTIQLILDVDLLRPILGLAGVVGPFGGGLPGGATEDMAGYGPVALYIGGQGRWDTRGSFKDLVHKSEPLERVSSRFRMQRLSEFYYAWCATSADINRDGAMDVVAGPFYYLGPDFTQRREFMASRTYNVSTEYASDMVDFAHDFTGDG